MFDPLKITDFYLFRYKGGNLIAMSSIQKRNKVWTDLRAKKSNLVISNISECDVHDIPEKLIGRDDGLYAAAVLKSGECCQFKVDYIKPK